MAVRLLAVVPLCAVARSGDQREAAQVCGELCLPCGTARDGLQVGGEIFVAVTLVQASQSQCRTTRVVAELLVQAARDARGGFFERCGSRTQGTKCAAESDRIGETELV